MKNIQEYLIKNKGLTLSLALAWTILIFMGCSLPGRDIPKVNMFEHFDKVVHFTFFMVFFILWFLYFGITKRNAFIIILTAFMYGFAIEFYQRYCVVGRSFDVWDGVADGIGAVLGWLVMRKK